jgi:hypothetical protein
MELSTKKARKEKVKSKWSRLKILKLRKERIRLPNALLLIVLNISTLNASRITMLRSSSSTLTQTLCILGVLSITATFAA